MILWDYQQNMESFLKIEVGLAGVRGWGGREVEGGSQCYLVSSLVINKPNGFLSFKGANLSPHNFFLTF